MRQRWWLLILAATLSVASVRYMVWQSTEDSSEEQPVDKKRLLDKKRALIMYHFHPCGRNVTTNIGVFFRNHIPQTRETKLFSRVDYIFVYGSASLSQLSIVHQHKNTRVIATPILPADLAGFGLIARHLWDREDWTSTYGRIIWLNAGTIGPLVTASSDQDKASWIDVVSGLISEIRDSRQTVITSTVSWEQEVHPQSNFMSCPTSAADLLLRNVYRPNFRSKGELIRQAEVGAGAVLFAANFTLFELTRRVFITSTTPALNTKNTFMEIEPNVSLAIFCKLNDAGYRSMARSVKAAAKVQRDRHGLDDARVSALMAAAMGLPDYPPPLQSLCTRFKRPHS